MICVDSSVWIDYFNGKNSKQTDLLDGFLGKERVIVGDLILTEVLQGFQADRDFKTAKKLLSYLPIFDMVGRELAIESAKNYRLLRKRGLTVRKTMDVLIATFCIYNRFALLHDDRDFEPFKQFLRLKTVSI
ncbi:hypothetical protein MNBD_NITROSPIRAE01-2184 [hydrothermal vent metagenome]|uniref:PIN domain-containing protein n=1 Tax=hydrothermal vent metagenome TaxID=652676 RepID=A0A3B1DFD9_9ZZZZ